MTDVHGRVQLHTSNKIMQLRTLYYVHYDRQHTFCYKYGSE